MDRSPQHDLGSLSEGAGLLLRRPFVTLGLAALGMVLAALPPLLQLAFALPNDDVTISALLFAGLFPLEMYFIPRFLAEADAREGGGPGNPLPDWERNFDARWLRAMLGKILLSVLIALGLLCLLLPGLALFFAFGWAPMRLLLRGETMAEAARGSLRMMARAWRRVLPAVLLLTLVNLGIAMILFWMTGSPEQNPEPRVQLTHPRLWAVNYLHILLSLWTSASLLALFRRAEAASEESSADHEHPIKR